jgi:hypothetical protein
MSTSELSSVEQTIVTSTPTILTYDEAVKIVTQKYLDLCLVVQEKFKHHHDLAGALEAGIRNFKDRSGSNFDQVIYNLCDNFLYCLEEIRDGNVDFFLYQVDKIKKKNGKVEKQKVSRLIGKAQMKIIMNESSEITRQQIFAGILECFKLLTTTNENGDMVFFPQMIDFVKQNLNDSKFYSKMLVSIDYAESILDADAPALNFEEANGTSFLSDSSDEDEKLNKKKNKNTKKKQSGGNPLEEQFMKGLENTKIAQLAKSISDKINPDEFPMLNDPTKLLSSLSSPEEGGLGELMKFVMTNVQDAMQQNNFDENELIQETTGLLGGLKNMAGFDPMSMFQNMAGTMGQQSENGQPQMPDMSQFAGIFENLNQTLGSTMQNIVEQQNNNDTQKTTKKSKNKK